MFICQMLVAIIGTTSTIENHAAQRAAVSWVCLYIAVFACTWGPQTWIYNTETFPLRIRALGSAMSVSSQWIFNFAIGYSTPYLVDSGPGKAGLGPRVFFVWSGCLLISIFVSVFFVYEPKGLSLEEVDLLFKTSTAFSSAKRNAEIKAARGGTQEQVDAKDVVIEIPEHKDKDKDDDDDKA